MKRESSGWAKGCLIAGGVILIVGLVCGGFATWAGWSFWQSPGVQRAYTIGSAAVGLSAEAMTAPGTAEMRAAGCDSATAVTPELLERFSRMAAGDGGALGHIPEIPVITCMTHTSANVPTCEDVARART